MLRGLLARSVEATGAPPPAVLKIAAGDALPERLCLRPRVRADAGGDGGGADAAARARSSSGC